MKKIFYLFLILMGVINIGYENFVPLNTHSVALAERPTPPYAKWGNIAVQKTKEKYPDADVVDYLHVGKEDKSSTTVEKFKLWLKGKDKEFGVLVDIEFTKASEEIVDISFKETDR